MTVCSNLTRCRIVFVCMKEDELTGVVILFYAITNFKCCSSFVISYI